MSLKSKNRSIDEIMKQKMTLYRLEVASAHRALQAAQAGDQKAAAVALTEENYTKFITRFVRDYPEVKAEADKIKEALTTGSLTQTPDMSSPAKQLAWGAGLAHFMALGKVYRESWDPALKDRPLNALPFYKEMKKSRFVRREMIKNAEIIASLVANPDTKLRWGIPGSWFYFNNQENLINMDILFSLIGGFEHVRAITFHEVGHSQLSRLWPPTMEDSIQAIKDIQEKAKTDENGKKRKKARMTKDEYKEMMRHHFKSQLMHRLFNPGEDNCVNRFAVRQGQKWPQDYGPSLNEISGTLTGVGQAFLEGSLENVKGTSFDDYESDQKNAIKGQKKKGKKKDAANDDEPQIETPEQLKQVEKAYRMLCHAVNMSFFVNNGLFKDTPEGWKSIGVDQDLIRGLFKFSPELDKKFPIRTLKKDADVTDFDGFAYLRELCSGKQGLENLQPSRRDELLGKAYMDAQVDGYNQKRNDIMEEILARYAQPLIDKLLDYQMDQLQKQMDQKKDQENDQNQDQDQQQDGEPQGGEGGQGGGSGQSQSGESDIEIIDDESDPDSGDGDGGEGDDETSDEDMSEDASGAGGAGDEEGDDDTVEVDGVGDMEMPDAEDDPKGGDGDGASNDNDGDDPSEDPGESVSDLVDEGQQDKGDENDQNANGQDNGNEGDKSDPAQPQKNGQQNGGGAGAGVGGGVSSIDDLPVGDWSRYQDMAAHYAGAIGHATRLLEKIRDMQVQRAQLRSRQQHSFLPKDGELDRFSVQKHLQLKKKQVTNQKVTKEDYQRFADDQWTEQPTDIDLVLLIDGSGSMNSGIKSGSYQASNGEATKLQAAIHSACILYEAARKVGINVHIAAWGPAQPIWIAGPKDTHASIGESISRLKNGLNSGTELYPVVESTVKRLSETKSKSGSRFTGFSHCIVLSDGDVGDLDKSVKSLQMFLEGVPKATVDVAILEEKKQGKNKIEQMADKLNTGRREQDLLTVHEVDPKRLTTTVLQMVAMKLKHCRNLLGTSHTNKKKTLRQTAGKMGLKR